MKQPTKRIPGPDPRPGWGYFENDENVFRVTSTDTPRPWANLINNGVYGAFFSQHALGYSFLRSPKTCEVTRWSLNESRPRFFDAGRYVYVKDVDSGDYWVGNPQPGDGRLYKDFCCRHSPGWSEISAGRNGIDFSYRFFIPLKANCEIWTVTVTNRSKATRRLALVPAVELPTRSTYLEARARYSSKLRAVRCVQPGDRMWNRLDTHLFLGLDSRVFAWDTSRADFWGVRGDPRRPKALETGLTNSNADTEWMVAALETRAVLKPGQSFTFNSILGFAKKDSEAAACLGRFRKPANVAKAFSDVLAHWKRLFSSGYCTLPDKGVERFLSTWGKHAMAQVTHGSRGKSIGYRDTVQDLRGYLLVEPSFVRAKMLWLISYIRKDGSTIRGIDPWTGKHEMSDIPDNPVWMAELVNAYVKETGDLDVLGETVGFLDGGRGTVWDHLVRIHERLVKRRGAHSLVLVGEGDWNDGLASFGRKGRGESAWLTLLVVRGLRMLIELADESGREKDSARMTAWRASLVKAFNSKAWDGEWYTYGWDDDGVDIGSRHSLEGKVHANVQTWAMMEKVVPPARQAVLWRSICKYLETDAGLLTCWPSYVHHQPTGARIAQLNPGWIENAAIYCHGTAFHMAGCVAARKGEEALKALQCYLPTNPLNPRCDLEPFAVTNFFVGPDSRHFGRAGYAWFTGSVSWFLFLGWEGILGIRPDFDGLRIEPCVPSSWTRWSATKIFRGARYEMSFRKPKGSAGGTVKRLVVNGETIRGNLVPLAGGRTCRVEVVLG